jgi:cytoskeletal protein CcmA (bactofilin family)
MVPVTGLFARNARPEPDAIEVLIGARARFSGQLQCDASIRIDGAVDQGQIETPANVIITETATVQCDITAKVVSIRGKFKGIIQADRVELLDGSQVGGVLNVNSFYMDDNVVMRAAVNIRADTVGDIKLPSPPTNPTIPVAAAPEPAAPTPAAE